MIQFSFTGSLRPILGGDYLPAEAFKAALFKYPILGRDIFEFETFPPSRGLMQVTLPRIVGREINWILKQKCHESICHP